MITSVSGASAPVDKRFIGHPLGLLFLVVGEGFERFAYYGTSSILALFLTKQLLLPGHVEHVLGMGAVRSMLAPAASPSSPLRPCWSVATAFSATSRRLSAAGWPTSGLAGPRP